MLMKSMYSLSAQQFSVSGLSGVERGKLAA